MSRIEKPKINLPQIDQSPVWLEEFNRLQRLKNERKEIWQDRIEIEVETRGIPYFFLCPLSDLHLGSSEVDYQALNRHLKIIKNYPIYTVLVGDLADLFLPTKHPDAMLGDLISPDDQILLVKRFIEELGDKCLGIVSGNHEAFLKKMGGVDIYKLLVDELKIPLLNNGGMIDFKVDNQRYKVQFWHRIARLNSQFNFNHAGKQAIRLSGSDADILISGDKHLGGVEQSVYGDRILTVAQLGTFKTSDNWGRNVGFVQKPQVFFPVFALAGHTKRVEVLPDIEATKELLDLTFTLWKRRGQALLGLNGKTKTLKQ